MKHQLVIAFACPSCPGNSPRVAEQTAPIGRCLCTRELAKAAQSLLRCIPPVAVLHETPTQNYNYNNSQSTCYEDMNLFLGYPAQGNEDR